MQEVQGKTIYNNYSDGLRKELAAARPKVSASGKKQVVYFQCLKRHKRNGRWVYPNSVMIPSVDTIRDPYSGEYIDIAYLIRPSTGETGKIVFDGSKGGRILCTEGAAGNALFDFLYLSNYNSDNKDKADRNIRPVGGYIYEQLKPAVSAAEQLKQKRRVRSAQEAIDGFPSSLLNTYAFALNIKGVNEFTDEEELRIKLFDLAERNPDVILSFDRDYDKKLELWCRRLEEKSIIEWGNGKCILSATGEKLFTFKVGANRAQALKDFLLEHDDVKTMLKQQLEEAEGGLVIEG